MRRSQLCDVRLNSARKRTTSADMQQGQSGQRTLQKALPRVLSPVVKFVFMVTGPRRVMWKKK